MKANKSHDSITLLKRIIFILLLLDAIIGTLLGIVSLVNKDSKLFEQYYLIIYYSGVFYIWLITTSIIKLVKRHKEKKLALEVEQARLREERLKEIQRKRELENERIRIKKVQEEIDRIVTQYMPEPLAEMIEKSNCEETYATEAVNHHVMTAVDSFKKDQKKDWLECTYIQTQIKEILNIDKSTDDKLAFLLEKIEQLKQLAKSEKLCRERIKNRKIEILTEYDSIALLETLFKELNMSEKCTGDIRSIKALVTNIKPTELGIFNYTVEPLMLKYEEKSYCVFESVILVFDSDGLFESALNPSTLRMDFNKRQTIVSVVNNRIENNTNIGSDSRLLHNGETTYKWLYTRKDGLPDRRHTYNPCTEYRKDKYEYGIFSFHLYNTAFTYTFSSAIAVIHFLELLSAYDETKYDNIDLCTVTIP